MKNERQEAIHTFLGLRKKGKNINEQFKTVQETNVTTNEHGVKWDKELEKVLSILLSTPYRILLDESNIYVSIVEHTYIQVPYLIYGEQQDIYADFNFMKMLNSEIKDTLVLTLYKDLKDGVAFFNSNIPTESTEKVFILTNQFQMEKEITEETVFKSFLEALNRLDKEVNKNENVDSKEDLRLSHYIEEKLGEKGVSKSELAEKVGIKYKTLISKFKINSITGEELIRISIALDLDLNELKSVYMRAEENKTIPEQDMNYIASLVKIGFTSGIVPYWELELAQKQLYPLTKEERRVLSEEIEKGYKSGYLKGDYPRAWKLRIGKTEVLEGVKETAIHKYKEHSKEQVTE
jgi:DNA-binding Xre family transcriptional regulator